MIESLIQVDHIVLNYLQTLSNPVGDKFFLLVTTLGSTSFLVLVILALWLLGKKKVALVLSFALLINVAVTSSLKNILGRPRPGESITVKGDSFPSGHTTNAFIAFSILSYYFREEKKYLFFLAVLVGFSRLWLGVHYLSDVLAGALIGYGLGWLILKYQKREIKLSKRLQKLFSS